MTLEHSLPQIRLIRIFTSHCDFGDSHCVGGSDKEASGELVNMLIKCCLHSEKNIFILCGANVSTIHMRKLGCSFVNIAKFSMNACNILPPQEVHFP